jgi:hypothetical protein
VPAGEAGVLEQALLKADRSGAVLVLDVPDAATARAAVDSLPLVRHGATRFDLTELVEVPPNAARQAQDKRCARHCIRAWTQ